jgi:hypothetical protein
MDGGKRIAQSSSSRGHGQDKNCHHNVVINFATLSSNLCRIFLIFLEKHAGSFIYSTLHIYIINGNERKLLFSSSRPVSPQIVNVVATDQHHVNDADALNILNIKVVLTVNLDLLLKVPTDDWIIAITSFIGNCGAHNYEIAGTTSSSYLFP